MNLRSEIAKNYINLRAWKTSRRIVVFESDDWGSIRMHSKEVYDKLLEKGVPVDCSYFTKYDSLETNEDIYNLIGTLSKIVDKNGRHPIFTLNSVTANPDYEKINSSKFQKYFFQTIDSSYESNHIRSDEVLKIYRESVAKGQYFKPQFHGREHLNVLKFENNIQKNLAYSRIGVEYNCLLGLTKGKQIKSRKFYHSENYMAGFEALNSEHSKQINSITSEGLNLFHEIFGIHSDSFVAQSLIWSDDLIPVLYEKGIKYIQGAQQLIPIGSGKLKVRNRMTGYRNNLGQLYTRRNASFEPSSNHNIDWADKCLREIEIAFNWHTPAIINTHRVNYIGSIFATNREQSLKQLLKLLKGILKKWPNVEFFSSDELGNIMSLP